MSSGALPPPSVFIPPPSVFIPPPSIVTPELTSAEGPVKRKRTKKKDDRSFDDKLSVLLKKHQDWQTEELSKPVTWAETETPQEEVADKDVQCTFQNLPY